VIVAGSHKVRGTRADSIDVAVRKWGRREKIARLVFQSGSFSLRGGGCGCEFPRDLNVVAESFEKSDFGAGNHKKIPQDW